MTKKMEGDLRGTVVERLELKGLKVSRDVLDEHGIAKVAEFELDLLVLVRWNSEEDVLRLEVGVNDPKALAERQGGEHLGGNEAQVLHGHQGALWLSSEARRWRRSCEIRIRSARRRRRVRSLGKATDQYVCWNSNI